MRSVAWWRGSCVSVRACAFRNRHRRHPIETAYERLTQRQRQVLALVANGRSNREIAVALQLSVNTVAVHRACLKRTLAVRQTAALVLVALRHGLVTAD